LGFVKQQQIIQIQQIQQIQQIHLLADAL